MPAIFCQLCGQEISGQGKTVHHSNWPGGVNLLVCADCLVNKPRCQICSLPIASGTPLNVCPTCTQSGHICRACGQSIQGNYLEIEGAGSYCNSCYQERLACDICSAPLTDKRWQLSDGRISCAYCHATAIDNPQEALVLFEEVKSILFLTLGLKLNIPTGLALVDRAQLVDIIHQQIQVQSNLGASDLDPDKTLGIYTRQGIRRGMYVQSGLPRNLLLQIAAHEFAHAWQGENCPLLRSPLIHEGFAEWTAFHLLGYYGFSQQQRIMQERTDIYGKGLNWALDLESKEGRDGVINACLSSN